MSQGGQFHKYNTTRRTTQLLQFVKGLRAGWLCLVGCRLPTLFYTLPFFNFSGSQIATSQQK